MILVVACSIGIAALAATGSDLRRLAMLEIRGVWLVWVALGTQVVGLTVFGHALGDDVAEIVHLATYVTAGVFVVVNIHVPGVRLMGLGGGLNFVAIVANGGVMPASARAWELAGRGEGTGFANSVPVQDPKLLVLGDVFAIPSQLPMSNVFSIGDVILVVGLLWMVQRTCRAGAPATDALVSSQTG